MYKPDGNNIAKQNICITFLQHNAYRTLYYIHLVLSLSIHEKCEVICPVRTALVDCHNIV